MKRKIAASVISVVLLAGLAASVYADSTVKLFFNGKVLESDVPPTITDDRVLVPIRVISEAMGAKVGWDENTRTVTVDSNEKVNEKDKADSQKNAAKDLQIQRLEQALAPKDSLNAASSWAEGVKMRNGAWQYAVMSPEFKKEMYKGFEENYWSTGVSSPWIASYEINKKYKPENGTARYEVIFTYTDSTKATFTEREYITVNKYDGGWLVSSIEKVEVNGKITKLTSDANNEFKSVFVEAENVEKGMYDKANVLIGKETKIYKGYTNEEISASDLKEGAKVEVAFVDGPRLMIYPVSALAKTIRVME